MHSSRLIVTLNNLLALGIKNKHVCFVLLSFIRNFATMKKLYVVLFLGFAALTGRAAVVADSIADTGQPAQPKEIAKKPLTIGADIGVRTGGDYHIKRHGEMVERGRSSAMMKSQMRASGTLLRKGFSRLDASAAYTNYLHDMDGRELKVYDYGFGCHPHHNIMLGLSATTYLRLMGKPLMILASGNTTFSEHGYERWSASVMTLLMLKNTKETTLGVGLLGLVHSSARIPVYPMITYRQVLSPQWTINCVMPRFHVEYHLSENDMLSAGLAIDVDSYYTESDDARLPERLNYCRTNVNIGPAYEHKFPYGLTLRAETGAQWVVADRVYKNRNNHVEGRIHEKTAPYVCVGVTWKM